MLISGLLEKSCLNLTLALDFPMSCLRLSMEKISTRPKHRPSPACRRKAKPAKQHAADEKPQTFECVLGAGENGNPFEQRRIVPLGNQQLDNFLELIFVRSLAMPESACAVIT